MNARPEPSDSGAATRRIRYVASDQFPEILQRLHFSILLSTYHAGRVVVLSAVDGKLICELHAFDSAMGLAVHPRRLAVGTRHDIWFLDAVPDVAANLQPNDRYDTCLVARRAHHSGTIAIHEMAYLGDELWVAATLFSCLATIDEHHHFVPRWKPAFISGLHGPEDRCHLNGLAVDADGSRIRYVTCLGATDTPQGWRPNKANGGVLWDVPTQQPVSQGLCMPHSPRIYDGKIWILDSGRGELQVVERDSGRRTTVERFPGYPRGLAFHGSLAFVALSRIRETSVFGGIPIAENREQLKCGLAVVDLRSGRTIATFQFMEGVEELFDVKVLPGVRCPALRGPHPTVDEVPPIWVVPPLKEESGIVSDS